MMGIAISCLNLNIPIIHLCGGSVTKGSLDNIYRYCILNVLCSFCRDKKA